MNAKTSAIHSEWASTAKASRGASLHRGSATLQITRYGETDSKTIKIYKPKSKQNIYVFCFLSEPFNFFAKFQWKVSSLWSEGRGSQPAVTPKSSSASLQDHASSLSPSSNLLIFSNSLPWFPCLTPCPFLFPCSPFFHAATPAQSDSNWRGK
jgi:hypothetical protein